MEATLQDTLDTLNQRPLHGTLPPLGIIHESGKQGVEQEWPYHDPHFGDPEFLGSMTLEIQVAKNESFHQVI